jgi:hypothetical protein
MAEKIHRGIMIETERKTHANHACTRPGCRPRVSVAIFGCSVGAK